MIEEAKEELLKNKGAIVNISSVASLIPSSNWGIYGVVKAAQDKMTTNLAFGVRPGPQDTARKLPQHKHTRFGR